MHQDSEQGYFAADLARLYDLKLGARAASLPARIGLWLSCGELHCVACYRFGRYARALRLRNPGAGLLAIAAHRFWNWWITHIDHVDINHTAVIGPGLLVMHRHGLIVGGGTIGRNCVLHQNVTIGQRVAGGEGGKPVIGDDVWIGPAAILTGAITIGDAVTISAGSVLSKDVPANSLVAGNPGRVIARDYDNSSIMGLGGEPVTD